MRRVLAPIIYAVSVPCGVCALGLVLITVALCVAGLVLILATAIPWWLCTRLADALWAPLPVTRVGERH